MNECIKSKLLETINGEHAYTINPVNPYPHKSKMHETGTACIKETTVPAQNISHNTDHEMMQNFLSRFGIRYHN